MLFDVKISVLQVGLVEGFHVAIPYYVCVIFVCFFRMLCPCIVD